MWQGARQQNNPRQSHGLRCCPGKWRFISDGEVAAVIKGMPKGCLYSDASLWS